MALPRAKGGGQDPRLGQRDLLFWSPSKAMSEARPDPVSAHRQSQLSMATRVPYSVSATTPHTV